jgi:hypothetical protein
MIIKLEEISNIYARVSLSYTFYWTSIVKLGMSTHSVLWAFRSLSKNWVNFLSHIYQDLLWRIRMLWNLFIVYAPLGIFGDVPLCWEFNWVRCSEERFQGLYQNYLKIPTSIERLIPKVFRMVLNSYKGTKKEPFEFFLWCKRIKSIKFFIFRSRVSRISVWEVSLWSMITADLFMGSSIIFSKTLATRSGVRDPFFDS